MNKGRAMYPNRHSVYYRSCRWDIIRLIPENCQYILDVGCGEGMTGKAIKELRTSSKVLGIERDPDAANKAKRVLDDVIVGDVESIDIQLVNGPFDCIIWGDVLEHLVDPWHTLCKYGNLLSESGYMVISVPNVQHYSVILGLILGNWSYRDRGILDEGHLRFFTYKELLKLLDRVGLEPIRINWNIRLKEHTKSGRKYAGLIARLLPFLRRYFVFQYIVLAAPQRI